MKKFCSFLTINSVKRIGPGYIGTEFLLNKILFPLHLAIILSIAVPCLGPVIRIIKTS
ncbi:MAG: hypothetical protein H0X03_01035 [Nitrosopumilus sp.]|nr:hypothetical protein [Nitrosopumilus sp.]